MKERLHSKDTSVQSVAGYTFQEILDASHPEIEHWKGVGDQGVAEIFLLPHSWKARIDAIPKKWNAFCDFDVQYLGSKIAVIIPGFLHSDVYTLQRKLGPEAAVVFSWHIASALALLHDSGSAHGLLHAQSIGLDEDGKLSIRPGLLAPIQADPDKHASAQATDCWQLAHVIELLIGVELSDDRIRLLLGGLKQDRASIRLQPARALRQSLVAITENNPSWEESLKKTLGNDWGMDQLPPIEHSIIPKLYPQRPRAQLPQHVDPSAYNPWSSPFVSTKNESVGASKKISLPEGIKSEQKLRLPTLPKKSTFIDEELEVQEQDIHAPAQIRLPFAKIEQDTAMVALFPTEERYEESVSFAEDSEESNPSMSFSIAEEIDASLSVAVELSSNNASALEKQEEDASWEESEEDSISFHTDVVSAIDAQSKTSEKQSIVIAEMQNDAKEEQEDIETSAETGFGEQNVSREITQEIVQAPMDILEEESVYSEDSFDVSQEDIDSFTEEGVSIDEVVAREETKTPFLFQIPEREEDFIDFIDEDTLLSEEESLDKGEERSLITIETLVERRQIEQVEEVLLAEEEQEEEELEEESASEIEESIPVEEAPQSVPEFFDDSEDQMEDAEDYDSFESDDDLASASFNEDSVMDDLAPSSNEEDKEEWRPEDDFLSTIFNDRDITALEASSKNNLSAIIPKQDSHVHTAQSLEKTVERVAGFEASHEELDKDESFSQGNRFDDIAVVQSLHHVFEDNEPSYVLPSFASGEEPRWMAAKSITADPRREDELGSGKWGEAKSQLDHDILKEVMSSTPVRELDLEDDGNGWALLLLGLAVGLLGILFVYGVVSSL